MPFATLRRLTLALAVSGAALLVIPDASEASVVCKAKKKKAKKAKKAPKAAKVKKADKPEKVSGSTILSWHKRGDAEDDIIVRAKQAGYKLNAKDEKAFKAKKFSPHLIAGLKTPEQKAAEKVDLTKPASVADIDFDEVPPPPGTPKDVVQKQQMQKAEAKQVDHSLRPNAPFDESKDEKKADAPAGPTQMRKVIVAKDS